MKSALIISDKEKEELRDYISQLFFALTRLHWIRGNTFSMSRWFALKQIESYLDTKQKKHGAVAKYIIELYAEYKKPVCKLVMENPMAKENCVLTEQQKLITKKYSVKAANAALANLNAAINNSEQELKQVLNFAPVEEVYKLNNNGR